MRGLEKCVILWQKTYLVHNQCIQHAWNSAGGPVRKHHIDQFIKHPEKCFSNYGVGPLHPVDLDDEVTPINWYITEKCGAGDSKEFSRWIWDIPARSCTQLVTNFSSRKWYVLDRPGNISDPYHFEYLWSIIKEIENKELFHKIEAIKAIL